MCIRDRQLDVSFLRDRTYTEISGGERQMVLIARALTQKTHFLMMEMCIRDSLLHVQTTARS